MSDAASVAARLTPRQRECLGYVYDRLTSKEIAARTGLAVDTVDTYIKEAVAALGARNRRHAAELAYLTETIPRKLEPQSAGVALQAFEDQPSPTPIEAAGWAGLLPFRVKGSPGNDLGFIERIFIIIALAIGVSGAIGFLAVAARVVSIAYAGVSK